MNPSAHNQRRKTARSVVLVDRASRLGITAGGVAVILAILGILVFILMESLPLLLPGKVRLQAQFPPGGNHPAQTLEDMEARGAADEGEPLRSTADPQRDPSSPSLYVACDEYREISCLIASAPEIRLLDPRDGTCLRVIALDLPEGARITAADRDGRSGFLALGTSDGRLLLGHLAFRAEYRQATRVSLADFSADTLIELPESLPVSRLVARGSEESQMVMFTQSGAGKDSTALRLLRRTRTKSLLGPGRATNRMFDLPLRGPERITALALTSDGLKGFAGTSAGRVFRYTFAGADGPHLEEVLGVSAGELGRPAAAVTALAVLLGDNTLVAGTSRGRISSWFGVPDPSLGNAFRPFRRIHAFPGDGAPITALAVSDRNKCFAALDSTGSFRVLHNTTEREIAAFAQKGRPGAIFIAPKFDGVLTAGPELVRNFSLHAPHPEVSLKALFGKVWYEGYRGPEYVWQSTGGTDDFEGKFSLIPLIVGTLKGTIYALLFAVPIAVMAAIYTSQFLSERIRGWIKPTVEIMAALPSVVLGFLAGLYLAPRMEQMVPGTLLFLMTFPLVLLSGAVLWQTLPRRWVQSLPPSAELLALIPLVLGSYYLARGLGPVAEQIFFGGSFKAWLLETAGTRYDQRNCIVVGFAMGFAVIPIIFTISEDSLSSVPRNLIAGSMACGASRWQTALRIVAPAAGSGIFSAVMIGLGRAVGETMIVLMATGNTPIMDWSIFNGMRTLSANIAVEMPEAPYHGTLYRILFLAAFLLLLMTSVINTAAELIRVRVKRKFGNY